MKFQFWLAFILLIVAGCTKPSEQARPQSAPVVEITSIIGISQDTAVVMAVVSDSGSSAVTARGIVWDTLTNPTINLSTRSLNGNGIGSYAGVPYNLLPNTLYYVRAYATNSIGTSYSTLRFFTTKDIGIPTVTTNPVTDVSEDTATCGGVVVSTGGSPVLERGVVWDTVINPVINSLRITKNGSGAGGFTSKLKNLLPNKTYYVRAYATNDSGTAYGASVAFNSPVKVILPPLTYEFDLYLTRPTDITFAKYTVQSSYPSFGPYQREINVDDLILPNGVFCYVRFKNVVHTIYASQNGVARTVQSGDTIRIAATPGTPFRIEARNYVIMGGITYQSKCDYEMCIGGQAINPGPSYFYRFIDDLGITNTYYFHRLKSVLSFTKPYLP